MTGRAPEAKIRQLAARRQATVMHRAQRKVEEAVAKAGKQSRTRNPFKPLQPETPGGLARDRTTSDGSPIPITRGELRIRRLAEAAAALPSPPPTLTPRWPAWLVDAGIDVRNPLHPFVADRRRFLLWLERPIHPNPQTGGLGMTEAEIIAVIIARNVRDYVELVAGFGPGTDEFAVAAAHAREALAPFTARAALSREMARPPMPKGYWARGDADLAPSDAQEEG